MLFQEKHPLQRLYHWNQPRIVILVLVLLSALSALSACSVLRQPAPTPQLNTLHVTADEVALAMQQDHFYSDYNPYALLVQGKVSNVHRQNQDNILELATQTDLKVLCDFGSQAPKAKAGQTIQVLSPNPHQAQREPDAVLLLGCSIP